jgi:hypothetical protein
MNDDELNRRELTGDDAIRFARESGMEQASFNGGLFLAGVGDLIRFARLVRAGWQPERSGAFTLAQASTWRTGGPGGALVRVCEISDAECSRGCNVGPCVRAAFAAKGEAS